MCPISQCAAKAWHIHSERCVYELAALDDTSKKKLQAEFAGKGRANSRINATELTDANERSLGGSWHDKRATSIRHSGATFHVDRLQNNTLCNFALRGVQIAAQFQIFSFQMGSSQSQEPRPKPPVVRIEKTDVPEEYRSVGVSSEVIQRVQAQQGSLASSGGEVDKLKNELLAERERAETLRQQMNKLSDLQMRNAGSSHVSMEELEERKKVFDETVERVEKQFFNYQRENACSGNESDLMKCLDTNKDRVLNCSSLVGKYRECVNDFRKEVLSQS
ncbi:hypothetical protein L596_003098 [Steinernema carpocapsae]|uniref:CHCH domain-containing protein n=1 Tax=Steinernema carpocapsae TaxID=34508 RepID=A0A4U8UT26_STECR|nr:hypothetical protein L596_003098 [Steinernema carpocapsae]